MGSEMCIRDRSGLAVRPRALGAAAADAVRLRSVVHLLVHLDGDPDDDDDEQQEDEKDEDLPEVGALRGSFLGFAVHSRVGLAAHALAVDTHAAVLALARARRDLLVEQHDVRALVNDALFGFPRPLEGALVSRDVREHDHLALYNP